MSLNHLIFSTIRSDKKISKIIVPFLDEHYKMCDAY